MARGLRLARRLEGWELSVSLLGAKCPSDRRARRSRGTVGTRLFHRFNAGELLRVLPPLLQS